MALPYTITIVGDTSDATALQAAVTAFVAQLELTNTADATLTIEEPPPPPKPLDLAHEPLVYQIDVTGRATPVVVSARGGEYVGVGATIDDAKADLLADATTPPKVVADAAVADAVVTP